MARAHIVGAGPAGSFCALVLDAAGWDVVLQGDAPAPSPHVHVVDLRALALLRGVMPTLAQRLEAGVDADWAWHIGGAVRTAPRLSRRHVCATLDACVRERGIVRRGATEARSDADLIVDATGSARTVIRQLEDADIVLDASDAMETYASRPFRARNAGRRTYRHDTGYAYVEQDGHGVTVTQLLDGKGAKEDLQALAEGFLGEGFLSETGEDGTGRAVIYRVPSVSHLSLPSGLSAPVIAFGDALVQASPHTGFGLLSIFQQGQMLQDWTDRGRSEAGVDVDGLRDDLDDYASGVVAGMAFQSLI